MSVSKIKHKGKEIIYVDHTGLSGDDLINNYKDACEIIKQEGQGCLMLVDFRDASMSTELQDYIKTKESKEAVRLLGKQAIVGITGIKKIVFNSYLLVTGSNMKLCDNVEEAKNYLVS